jgi:F0F1-type ATP synthase membrane subunit c/vacuolar-type H+-ATPase subunit K
MLSFLGVSVGVGNIFGNLILGLARNQAQKELLIRWAFIGFSLVEVSGFIGLVYSFLILFAF